MPRTSRRRGRALVVDLRGCSPSTVEDLTCFEGIAADLRSAGPSEQIRSWVLHDQVVTWTRDALSLLEGLGALWLLIQEAPEAAGDVVILPHGAAACPALSHALAAIGLPSVPTRKAGGLPLEEVTLEKRTFTTLTQTPLVPISPAPLAGLFASQDPAMEEPILDFLEGLLDRWGRHTPDPVV